MKNSKRFLRFGAALLAFVLFALALPLTALAAGTTRREILAAQQGTFAVKEGIYHIINNATGKFLEAFDYKFDAWGRMHLDGGRGAAAQNFLIVPHDDGTYSLCPMSEDNAYMVEYEEDAVAGDQLYKTSENKATTRFRITKNTDGSVRISPSVEGLDALALAESSTTTAHYYYNVAELQSADAESAAQRWTLELTDLSYSVSFKLNKSSTVVKLYTINDIVAVVTPAAYADRISWKSANRRIALVDGDGSFAALACGTTRVTATLGDVSKSCAVTVTDKDAFTWYSQCNMYSGGWNAAALSGVYFYADYQYKPFVLDGFNGKCDWMDEGCALCCYAMVLNNMGARMTEGYDLRSRRSGNLEADPYTCALANSYNNGDDMINGIFYGNPIYTASRLIASRFKVGTKSIATETYYCVTKQMLKELLDEHPEGVVVGMDSYYSGTHFVVFTKCINPDAAYSSQYEFLICDPAAYDADDGANVRFEESYSYNSLFYRYYDIESVTVYSVQ